MRQTAGPATGHRARVAGSGRRPGRRRRPACTASRTGCPHRGNSGDSRLQTSNPTGARHGHGFRAPTELAVDNRALLDALCRDCERLRFAGQVPACPTSMRNNGARPANGIDAPGLVARPAGWRPVKGEVLRCRDGDQVVCPCRRVIRARVRGRQVYLRHAPTGGRRRHPIRARRDTAPVVMGVRDLLDDACTVPPALVSTSWPSVRPDHPMTPDNLSRWSNAWIRDSWSRPVTADPTLLLAP